MTRHRTPECLNLVLMDAFPSQYFQVNSFEPCCCYPAHRLSSDKMLLRDRYLIWRLKLSNQNESFNNFMTH